MSEVRFPDQAEVRWGADGLVPAVVRDAADGEVLMVAYMDAEAYAATIATSEVHFHSRSRRRLWKKGESSGNVLRLRSMVLDCDNDALLVTADPAGPTCHTGARSCFDRVEGSAPGRAAAAGFGFLEELWTTIDERATERPASSYTVALLDGGVDAVGRKVTEEATEVLMAAKDDAVAEAGDGDVGRDATRRALAAESADLVYHLLVLLRERGLSPSRVLDELRARHGE